MTTAKPLQKSLFRTVPKFGKTLVMALAITLLALALAQQIAFLETELVKQIAPALADFGVLTQVNGLFETSWAAKALEFALLLLIVVLALEIGQRFKQTAALIVVTVQLYVISFVAQALLLAGFNVMPLIVTTLVAITLSCATGVVMRQTAERNKVLEAQYYELQIRNDELDFARKSLVELDEVGRALLAADLHDQVLNDLKKILETFSQFEKDPENKSAGTAIRAGFNKSMIDIREIMDDLSPIMLQNFGMRAAVEDCLEKSKERSGFATNFDCQVEDDVLEKPSRVQQLLLFRLIQESLTNISKHAKASRVTIKMTGTPTVLTFAIEDDGKGIDYDSISHQSRGLRYMKLRADLIDAVVEWMPGSDGKGTKVVITFPLTSKQSTTRVH